MMLYLISIIVNLQFFIKRCSYAIQFNDLYVGVLSLGNRWELLVQPFAIQGGKNAYTSEKPLFAHFQPCVLCLGRNILSFDNDLVYPA